MILGSRRSLTGQTRTKTIYPSILTPSESTPSDLVTKQKRSTLHPQIIKRWSLSNTSKNWIPKSETHKIRVRLSHLVKRINQDTGWIDVGALSPFSSNYGHIGTTLPLYTEMGHSSSKFGLPDPAVIWTHDLPFRRRACPRHRIFLILCFGQMQVSINSLLPTLPSQS